VDFSWTFGGLRPSRRHPVEDDAAPDVHVRVVVPQAAPQRRRRQHAGRHQPPQRPLESVRDGEVFDPARVLGVGRADRNFG
jgi:hypothetical protein